MKVVLTRQNQALHFHATSADGNIVSIDANPAIGGDGKGMRPMELLLAALGSCAVFDIVLILKKQQEPLHDIRVEVNGHRGESVPAPFTSAHLHFTLYGELSPEKVSRACELGVTKYCSVGATIDKTTTITHSFEILPAE